MYRHNEPLDANLHIEKHTHNTLIFCYLQIYRGGVVFTKSVELQPTFDNTI